MLTKEEALCSNKDEVLVDAMTIMMIGVVTRLSYNVNMVTRLCSNVYRSGHVA